MCPDSIHFLQVLLPKAVTEAVQDNLRIGLPNSPMMDGLLQSSRLRECHLTPLPVTWYKEEVELTQEHQYVCVTVSAQTNIAAL